MEGIPYRGKGEGGGGGGARVIDTSCTDRDRLPFPPQGLLLVLGSDRQSVSARRLDQSFPARPSWEYHAGIICTRILTSAATSRHATRNVLRTSFRTTAALDASAVPRRCCITRVHENWQTLKHYRAVYQHIRMIDLVAAPCAPCLYTTLDWKGTHARKRHTHTQHMLVTRTHLKMSCRRNCQFRLRAVRSDVNAMQLAVLLEGSELLFRANHTRNNRGYEENTGHEQEQRRQNRQDR